MQTKTSNVLDPAKSSRCCEEGPCRGEYEDVVKRESHIGDNPVGEAFRNQDQICHIGFRPFDFY